MTMRTASCILLLALAFSLAIITQGFAKAGRVTCTCTPAPLEQRAQTADRIYVGRVRTIEIPENMQEPGRDDPPAIVTLDVTEALKGLPPGTKKDELRTSLTHVTCAGHPFEEGKDYLVFSYKRLASTYETWSLYDFKTGTYDVGGLCGGTKQVDTDEVLAEIQQLRDMKKAGQLPDNAMPELEH